MKKSIGRLKACLIAVCAVAAPLLAQTTNPSNPGTINSDILKIDAAFVRLHYLVVVAGEAGAHLGFQQSDLLLGQDDQLERARGQYDQGAITHDQFLDIARQRLAVRQSAVDAALGDKEPAAKAVVLANPYWNLQQFDDLFRLSLDPLQLSADVSQETVGYLNHRRVDLEKERTDRAIHAQTGEPVAPLPSADWASQWEQETILHVMNELTVPQRAQVIQEWPALFPEGPAAPATDNAAPAKSQFITKSVTNISVTPIKSIAAPKPAASAP